jgi:hypothetical protein
MVNQGSPAFGAKGACKKACGKVIVSYFAKLRILLLADLLCIEAPGVKTASGRRADGARHIPGQDNAFPLSLGIGNRGG